MFPTVTYNRSIRVYQVPHPDTGEIAEFPAGCKAEAERWAIAAANPRLARIVRDEVLARHPYLESRAWKAAAYLLEDRVTPAPDDPLYFAYVTGNGNTYALRHEDDLMSCTCSDYAGFGAPLVAENGQRLCCHLISWSLFQRLQLHRCYHCQKLVDAAADVCPNCHQLVTPF